MKRKSALPARIRQRNVAIFSRLREANPQPKTELEYATPYQLLVAVVLSAQATDRSVNIATRPLFKLAPTPAAMLGLGEERLREMIGSIGLYRTKAKNVIGLSQLLLECHAGEVPDDAAALEALPGVGHKTANVVLNTIFHKPVIAVDTHIFRVSNRTGLAPGKDVKAVEAKLLESVPAEFMLDAHHWLILLGRYICKARKPECGRCPINDLCEYPDKLL
ncbi:DNA glycosylase and apyrimidinic (AP) lyase (endonuclease III) [Sterolibacterium denitrificans]|uniref:Endonuclease III n=1 Tax=Sterolibacterium denitrificans TaxID=157592 RepID=A0A7Z7HR10_9PROT|nr:endonuclease III [Sterolibacterium denitrificans]SMB24804.1 DNA glycosylase and apyrimidinic (AP) lyase (endonuclease III) [Sterolibacterium denitrificans]